MDEYKDVIENFLENIEKLDKNCDIDSLTDRDIFLFSVIRACRNKLAETYNCIGDTGWVLPDLEW